MSRKTFMKTKYTHKTGKPMIGWWTGKKPCNCNRNPCPRPGGAACKRRTKRVKK